MAKKKKKTTSYFTGHFSDDGDPILSENIADSLEEVEEYFRVNEGSFDDDELIFEVTPVFQVKRPSAKLTPYNG